MVPDLLALVAAALRDMASTVQIIGDYQMIFFSKYL